MSCSAGPLPPLNTSLPFRDVNSRPPAGPPRSSPAGAAAPAPAAARDAGPGGPGAQHGARGRRGLARPTGRRGAGRPFHSCGQGDPGQGAEGLISLAKAEAYHSGADRVRGDRLEGTAPQESFRSVPVPEAVLRRLAKKLAVPDLTEFHELEYQVT